MKFSKRVDINFLQFMRLLRFKLHRRNWESKPVFDGALLSAKEVTSPFVLFTAADSVYLRRFLSPYCVSAAAHMAKPYIHVHLYNPELGDFAFLEKKRQEMPAINLTWSYENFDLSEWKRQDSSPYKQSWKSLYICTSRFLVAEIFQQKCKVPLLITDIDIMFNGDVEKRFGEDTDVSLLLRPTERNICKRSLGGFVYVSARPLGRAFIGRVAKDISRFLSAGFYWFAFDQLALYRAVQALPGAADNPNFLNLTSQDVSMDLAKEGLILYAKGKLKSGEQFDRLASTVSPIRDQESP